VKATRLLSIPALLVLWSTAFADTTDPAKQTIDYLRKLQTSAGGFAADAGKTQPSLRATSSALRALKYFGGDVPDRSAAARFVESCYDKKSGGFADAPGGKPDVATTAVGAMALVELNLPPAPYEAGILRYLGDNTKSFEEIRIAAAGIEALGKQPPQASDWLRQLQAMRHPDGTFADARETGGATVAILRLGGRLSKTQSRNVVTAMTRGQNADGAFGKGQDGKSDLETTYRVMRCYHRLNADLNPEGKKHLAVFIQSCRNGDGGYGVAPGQPSGVSGTYYAAMIRHWQNER
jgi:prenyltransferase beta subunit